MLANFRVQINRVVQGDKDRHLNNHRQAAGQRIHIMLLEQLHRLFLLLLRIVAILLLKLSKLRLQLLHLLRAAHLLHGER